MGRSSIRRTDAVVEQMERKYCQVRSYQSESMHPTNGIRWDKSCFITPLLRCICWQLWTSYVPANSQHWRKNQLLLDDGKVKSSSCKPTNNTTIRANSCCCVNQGGSLNEGRTRHPHCIRTLLDRFTSCLGIYLKRSQTVPFVCCQSSEEDSRVQWR